ncbi:MAG: ATP-binding protein [Polyangiales bacterium]
MKFKDDESSAARGLSLTPKNPVDAATLVLDEFASESLKESYAQLKAGFFGTCILVLLTVVALRIAGETRHFALWAAGHGIILAGSALVFVLFQKGAFLRAKTAHAARRLSALTGGIAWGAAGILWPISADRPSWIVLVGCFAVLASGAAVTMASDPPSFVLLIIGTLAPALSQAQMEIFSWGVVTVYSGVCFATLLRNRSVFRNMVKLRSENSELLAQALASAKAAEHARDQALEAGKDKTRFLAAASHDLRQPMQAITLLSQTLTRTPLEQLDDIQNTASSIEDAALELTSLFEGILDLSQLELETKNEAQAINLRSMLDDVAAGMLLEAEAREMTVSVAGPQLTVFADPVLLWRVVSNLANNAMVHSRTDRILLSLRSRGEHCLLQVWDQGEGIREEDQVMIFEEFAQLRNAERRRDRGAGLGLSIVRRICASNRWEMGVESRVGRGSSFYVRLPRLPTPALGEAPKEGSDVSGLSVLVVEDDELVSKSLALALRSSGASVTLAPSAERALELIAAEASYDVVLSDCRLPDGTTGMQLADRLADTHPTLPCVILTGELQSGACDVAKPVVIRKPASHHDICDALSNAWAETRASSRHESLQRQT